MKAFVAAACRALAAAAVSVQVANGADFACADCHEISVSKSVHADLDCSDCHADVTNEDHAEAGAAPAACASCHDAPAATVATDIHHRLGLDPQMAPLQCGACHGSHEIQPPPPTAAAATAQICSPCHDNLTARSPYHRPLVPDAACADCHELTPHRGALAASVHAALACADCHAGAAGDLEGHGDEPLAAAADCSQCHRQQVLAHRDSIHGISLLAGMDEAANCADCHGDHDICAVDEDGSGVRPNELAATCGRCHDDPDFHDRHQMAVDRPGAAYANSVHGPLAGNGGADCSTCHGVHDIKNRLQPGSSISAFNLPQTCGRCHPAIVAEYQDSIHWARVRKGVRQAPVCNDCHNEHSILPVNGAGRHAAVRKLQEETCFRCHSDPLLARRYNLTGTQAASYRDSYHGLASRRGDAKVPMCIDCHGVHRILPQSHPESTVSPARVVSTCATCHSNATATFARSYSHASETSVSQVVEDLVRQLYTWLIVLVIGGMVVHNGLIFLYEIRQRRRQHRQAPAVPRMTRNEVLQHAVLLTSFIILAITGFALKFPDFFAFRWLEAIGMTETVRQWTHRSCGLVMVVLGVYHLAYLLLTKRGREVLRQILPRLCDVSAATQNVLFYLRLRRQPPRFAAFDYAEKAEYWALVWGTVVMAVTGAFLWMPTWVGDWAPDWFIKVSEIIHLYEATLAVLAIIVWHWFFVVFRPSTYPMSFVWLDGRMSLAQYKHHHAEHFQEMLGEWDRCRRGECTREELSVTTQQLLTALESSGHDIESVLAAELDASRSV